MSGHKGSPHWIGMRVTSIALIFLGLWLVYSLMTLSGLDPAQIHDWLHAPLHAVLLALFLLFGLHHSAHGVQVVIEDYVSCPWARRGALLAVALSHIAAAGFGLFAILAMAVRA